MKKINAIKSYILKNGQKKYRFTIRVDKKHVTSRNGFYTYDDAALAYLNLKQEIMENKYKADQNLITFKDVYDSWMERYKNTVRDTTLYRTERVYERRLGPAFGNKLINKITVKDCQEAVDSWAADIATFRPFVVNSNKVFDDAVKYGYITSNPMRRTDVPKKTKKMAEVAKNRKVKNYYSLTELRELLSAAKKESLHKYAFFRTIAYSGTRRGEIVALRWSDINFKTNYISINKALVWSSKTKSYEIHPTKNGKSRNLIMDQQTMEILKAWKRIQREFYSSKKSNDYVFTGPKGERCSFSIVETWLIDLNKKINLGRRVTLHGFRHTHATLLYSMNPNITPKDVQKRLGHSNVAITMNIYEHVTDDSDDKITHALTELDSTESMQLQQLPDNPKKL